MQTRTAHSQCATAQDRGRRPGRVKYAKIFHGKVYTIAGFCRTSEKGALIVKE